MKICSWMNQKTNQKTNQNTNHKMNQNNHSPNNQHKENNQKNQHNILHLMNHSKNLPKDIIGNIIDYMPGTLLRINPINGDITINNVRLQYKQFKYYIMRIGKRIGTDGTAYDFLLMTI
ncbi:MAG: hypothetical protein ACKPKO_24570, partial [Candidatus Fonsibacter sp.]